MGLHRPPTFRDGTVLIDAVFAKPGIECVNEYILPHKGGVGNHRCFILDFTSSSVIGTKLPNIVRCSAQKTSLQIYTIGQCIQGRVRHVVQPP
jgi:hypothetical protein